MPVVVVVVVIKVDRSDGCLPFNPEICEGGVNAMRI